MKDITPPESVVPIYFVPPTKKQIEETQKLELEYEQRNQENQAKEEAKLSALDKLAKLGLTEEEAKAIVGI